MIEIAPWISLAFLFAAWRAGLGAVLARALFVTCMYLIACGALAAGALALLASGGGALIVGLLFAGLAPIMMLGLVLLSTRTTKAQRRARPWLSIGAAIAVGLAVLWATPELGAVAPSRIAGAEAVGAWIAPLVFVVAAVFIALLGYGERGALQRLSNRDADL